MSRPSFPALGFDPTTGDPGAVQQVHNSVRAMLLQLAAVGPRLDQALSVTDDWSGDAADDFHDYGDDLPRAIQTGTESAAATMTALQGWYGQMVPNQQKAEALERAAQEHKDLWEETKRRLASLGTVDFCSTDSSDREKGLEIARLERRKARLEALFREVVADAKKLEKKHLDEANAAADAIKDGKGDAFETVSGLAQAMNTFSKVTSIASSALTATGLILTPFGGLGAPLVAAGGAAGVMSSAAGGYAKANHVPGAPSYVESALGAFTPGKGTGVLVRGLREGKGVAASARAAAAESAIVKNANQVRDLRRPVEVTERNRTAAAERLGLDPAAPRTAQQERDVRTEVLNEAGKGHVRGAASTVVGAAQTGGVPFAGLGQAVTERRLGEAAGTLGDQAGAEVDRRVEADRDKDAQSRDREAIDRRLRDSEPLR